MPPKSVRKAPLGTAALKKALAAAEAKKRRGTARKQPRKSTAGRGGKGGKGKEPVIGGVKKPRQFRPGGKCYHGLGSRCPTS